MLVVVIRMSRLLYIVIHLIDVRSHACTQVPTQKQFRSAVTRRAAASSRFRGAGVGDRPANHTGDGIDAAWTL